MSCARTTGYDQGFSLSVNRQKVKKADKVKFLGVIIDENLTWDDQIKHLENKLLATIVLIKRIKKFILKIQKGGDPIEWQHGTWNTLQYLRY